MKRIYGISVWYWMAMAAIVAGLCWWQFGSKTPKPSESAEKTFRAARELLIAEHLVISSSWDLKYPMRAKAAVEKAEREKETAQRQYLKMQERLKRDQSILSSESDAIDAWVRRGRDILIKFPRTAAALMKANEKKLAESDKEWRLLFEEDLIDVLEKH